MSLLPTRLVAALAMVFAASVLAAHAEEEHDLTDETAAIQKIRGFASNIQKNRDGTVRFVRFSKLAVKNEHVQAVRAFSRIDYLAVVTKAVTDDALECLDTLTNLDTLCLSNSSITDKTVARIPKLVKLERLYLDGTGVTDAGMESLRGNTTIRVLELSRTAISDAAMDTIATIENLEALTLSNTKVSSKALESIAKLGKLRVLVLDRTQVNDMSGLANAASLQVLDVSDSPVDHPSVERLLAKVRLKHLIARGDTMSSEQALTLRDAHPKTQIHLSPTESERQSPLAKYLAGQELKGPEDGPIATQELQPGETLSQAKDRFRDEETPDFQRHVVPLLGRLGCNGRSCHGSFQGRGGFRLSMFGYDFDADWKAICQGDSPRVDRKSPEESLVILKPTESEPHEGGQRFEVGGWEHRLLLAWIRGGAPNRSKDAAGLLRLEVTPAEIRFDRINPSGVQMKVVAVWSDGDREDVTCLARFQTKDDAVAEVSADGAVESVGPGDTHVIISYDNGVVAVPVLRPYAEPRSVEKSPPSIDSFIESKLAKLGIQPSGSSTDEEFLRRVSLDITGTLPTPSRVRQFVEDQRTDKRTRLVEELLSSNAYVEWWTMRFSDLTGSNAQHLGSTDMNTPAAGQWNDWLRRRVRENVGWDRIAAGVILAESRRPGQDYNSYAAEQSLHRRSKEATDFSALENPMHYYWFRGNNQTPSDRALAFGYVFLGVRLECAQCHKHPFDQWSQEDFNLFTQFFTRIKAGVAPDSLEAQSHLKTKLGVPKKLDTAALRRQMYLRVSAEGLPIPWNEIWIVPPREKPHQAKLLGGAKLDLNDYSDPREPLFRWLVAEGNPYFAKAFVNRVWAHYFGRGLVEPQDDLNLANPPSHPGLMNWLAEQFVENDYDMKWLHTQITTSRAYQRTSQATASNRADERNYSHAGIRRLPAEVAIDAILQATISDAKIDSFGDTVNGRKIAQHPKSFQARGVDYSLLIFGKPLRTTNCDCERQAQPTLLQSIYRRNDQELLQWLERPDGWLMEQAKAIGQPFTKLTEKGATPSTAVDRDPKRLEQWLEQAYLRTMNRTPTADERRRIQKHFAEAPNQIEALRDLLWVLLNSQEFITNH